MNRSVIALEPGSASPPSSASPSRSPSRPACPARSARRPADPRPRPPARRPRPHPDADARPTHAHARARRSSCTRSSRGDTLTRIARRFHTSTRSLSYWNREAYPTLDPESAHYRPTGIELRLDPPGDARPGVRRRRRTTARPGSRSRPRPTTTGPRRTSPSPSARRSARRGAAVAYPRGMSPAAGSRPGSSSRCRSRPRQSEPGHRRAQERAVPRRRSSRHGAVTVPLDATASAAERESAPSRRWTACCSAAARTSTRPATAQAVDGAHGIERERDVLEAAAWDAAEARGLPVLGICRGFQAMNVFAGGPAAAARRRARRTRLGPRRRAHPPAADRPGDAAHPDPLPGERRRRRPDREQLPPPGRGPRGPRVAVRAGGVVARAGRRARRGVRVRRRPFRMAVQCHPERTESTPKAFDRLFAFFVDACRGPAADR